MSSRGRPSDVDDELAAEDADGEEEGDLVLASALGVPGRSAVTSRVGVAGSAILAPMEVLCVSITRCPFCGTIMYLREVADASPGVGTR